MTFLKSNSQFINFDLLKFCLFYELVSIFRLKGRQDFALSLPTFPDYKKPMVVGKKVTPRDVVIFRNAIKSYGSGKNRKEVLKGMNMTIKEGSM